MRSTKTKKPKFDQTNELLRVHAILKSISHASVYGAFGDGPAARLLTRRVFEARFRTARVLGKELPRDFDAMHPPAARTTAELENLG
jgi:hypothetical protein